MWHSVINKTYVAGEDNNVARVFTVDGPSCTFQDFKVYDTVSFSLGMGNARPGQAIFAGSGADRSNLTIQGVWTEYCSLFVAFSQNGGKAIGNRARNTYKDVMHIASNSSGWLFENNTVRNGGDDGIALIRYGASSMANNIVRNNTVELCWWGRGISVGGDNALVENNVASDCVKAGIWVFIEQWNTSITHSCKDFLIQNNTIRNCGNDYQSSIVSTNSAFTVRVTHDKPFWGRIENNDILDNMFHGATIGGFVGDGTGTATRFYFINNVIDAPSQGSPWVHKLQILSSPNNAVTTPNTHNP